MIPKEKAQELVDKFLPEIRGADRYNYNLESMNIFIAKQCALIAVDELIKATETVWFLDGNYWEKVKSEIEKL